jgi:RHS repeat-associated protein
MPIRFERIYDNRVDYDSPLGYGWAHSYDMRVYRYPDGSVMLRRTCGGRRLFVPSGGGYISPAGEFRNTLLEDGDGTLTLIESSGTEYAFDLKGRLESIQDAHGNRLEMSYDPAGRLPLTGTSKFTRDPNAPGIVALDYRLTQVRERNALGSLTGRSIALAYHPTSGRLQTVSDNAGRSWNYSQDAEGNLIGVSGPAGLSYTYAYNDADPHNLTSLGEPPSAFTLLYDAQDRVTRQTLNSGTVFDFTYNVAGLRTTVVETVKDSLGATSRTATTVYEFNSYGNPTKMTDTFGNEFEYLRDGSGNTLTRTIKQNVPGTGLVLLKTVTYSYDAAGNLTSESHAIAATGETVTKTYTYDHNFTATTRIASSLNPTMVHGSDIVYAHNARGYPTVATQEKKIISGGNTPTPTFFTVNYTADSFGARTLATYPNGDTDSYSYTNGVMTGVNGETTQRDPRGNMTARIDRNNNAWHYTYDDLDRVLTAEDPSGAMTILTYTGPLLTQIEVGKTATAPGRIYVMTYDAAGRVLQTKRQTPAGLVTILTYTRDSEGRPLTQTDGAGRTTTTIFDALGRPATIQFGAGGPVTQQYDAFGNLTRAVDGAGRVTRYTNWVVEQPAKPQTVINGLNKTYTAVLNADGSLRTLTDPLGRALTEVHDALGRLTSFSGPFGVPTQYSYGGRSTVATRTDALGAITNYTYNARGVLTGVDYPGPDAVTLTRDLGDRLTRAVDLDSDMTWGYDGSDRVTLERNNLTGRQVTTAYNSIGLRTSVTTSDGVTVLYEYDDFDLLKRVKRNGTTEVTYTRDGAGQVSRTDYGNGTFTTYTRDGAGRVQVQEFRDATNTLLSRITNTRDGSGLVTVKREVIRRPDGTSSDLFTHYTYDNGLRMTREEIRASDDTTIMSARTFTYDDVGNRLTMAFDGGATTTYAYSTSYRLDAETTGGSSITYVYDANGNLLTETFGGQTVTYGYDRESRLTSLDSPTDSADYILSWDGRRLAKNVNGVVTEYLHDGLNTIAEYPAGSPSISYLTAAGLDELILKVQGGSKSYYNQADDLRTVLQLTDTAGVVQNSYVHRAFGELLESTVNTPNVHTFTGRVRDAETPHLYFRERLYSPRTGRFLSLDPYRPDATRTERIGGPQRLARSAGGVQESPLFGQRRDVNVTGMDVTGYLYVGNNPTNATDPTGEVIIWNPISGSISSGCTASGCGLSGCGGSACLGSACGASACGLSGCTLSGCGLSGCGASGCGASLCAGSACGGSGCGGSACLISTCTGSGCVGTMCYGSVCGGSVCIGSACIASNCAGSICAGSSVCAGSICTGSNCLGSVCTTSDCANSLCSANSQCGGSACTGSTCNGSSCSSSGCTTSGCNASAGCSSSGCTGSACNAGSGCNSPCCK